MTSVQEAIQQIISQAKSFGTETVSIDEAYGRVLTQDIVADRDYPPFNRATMDGFAVQTADFQGKEAVQLHLLEKLFAGGKATQPVTSGNCIKIMTGAPVPAGADAVVRVEDTQQAGDMVSFQIAEVRSGLNIARQGEDAREGEALIKKNQYIDATVLGALAVTGYARVEVEKLPQVAILSTGNEVIPVGEAVLPHQIRDSNTYTIASFLKRFGIHTPFKVIVQDNKAALQETLSKLLEKDMIILSGGVSKGEADYVPEVLLALGVKQVFHRIKIKPGAPLWFGVLPNGGVVFGLPGNPVSVQVACRLFIEPYLRTCFGIELRWPVVLPFLGNKNKKTKFDEFFPCKIVSGSPVSGLLPVRYNGSGDIAATLGSDGIALHPETTDNLDEFTPVQFYFW